MARAVKVSVVAMPEDHTVGLSPQSSVADGPYVYVAVDDKNDSVAHPDLHTHHHRVVVVCCRVDPDAVCSPSRRQSRLSVEPRSMTMLASRRCFAVINESLWCVCGRSPRPCAH